MKPFIILCLIAISIVLSTPLGKPNLLLDPTCDSVKISAGQINFEDVPYR